MTNRPYPQCQNPTLLSVKEEQLFPKILQNSYDAYYNNNIICDITHNNNNLYNLTFQESNYNIIFVHPLTRMFARWEHNFVMLFRARARVSYHRTRCTYISNDTCCYYTYICTSPPSIYVYCMAERQRERES